MRTARIYVKSAFLPGVPGLLAWVLMLGVSATLFFPDSGRCREPASRASTESVEPALAQDDQGDSAKSLVQRGTVLKLGRRGQALIDSGSDSGLAIGDRVDVYNVVNIQHPVTGQEIRDELLLGHGTVVRIGRNVSWIEVRPLTRDLHVKVGDVVVRSDDVVVEAPKAATQDAHDVAVNDSGNWEMGDSSEDAGDWSMGAAVDGRAVDSAGVPSRRSIRYRRGNGSYRYGYHGPKMDSGRYVRRSPRPARVAHDPISKVIEGQNLTFSVAIGSKKQLKSVRLKARVGNSENWRDYEMRTVGDTAWEVVVPSNEIKAGTLEYYIVAEDDGGAPYEVFRSRRRPWRVTVAVRPGHNTTRRTTFHTSYEWQEFYLDNPNRDSFWRAELDFAYDLQSRFLRNIRVGFGAFEGIGERNYNLEADPDRDTHYRAIGYGFFQPEFHFGQWVRFSPRLSIGAVADFDNSAMKDREFSGDPDYHIYARGEPIAGVSVRLNFGKEDGLNFTVGGGYMMTIGVETMAGFSIDAFPGVPVGATVTVTNLPVEEDWAGQVMMNFGWNGLEWLSLQGKFGFNIRNIHHAGLGGGLDVAFHW